LSHLKTVVLIIRNLSFIRNNEHHFIKSLKLIEIITSLFVDLIDQEVTLNCLDILTNVAKHIVLSDLAFGAELVDALLILIGQI
jgi:hypothetical protein